MDSASYLVLTYIWYLYYFRYLLCRGSSWGENTAGYWFVREKHYYHNYSPLVIGLLGISQALLIFFSTVFSLFWNKTCPLAVTYNHMPRNENSILSVSSVAYVCVSSFHSSLQQFHAASPWQPATLKGGTIYAVGKKVPCPKSKAIRFKSSQVEPAPCSEKTLEMIKFYTMVVIKIKCHCIKMVHVITTFHVIFYCKNRVILSIAAR